MGGVDREEYLNMYSSDIHKFSISFKMNNLSIYTTGRFKFPELRDPRDFGFNICGRLATSLMMKVLSFIPEINYTDIFFLF